MKKMRLAIAFALALLAVPAFAQSKPEYIKFAQGKGALYKPDAGPAPHVGVLVMHRTGDYLDHPACTELSKRGFMMLCMNTRYENNETMVNFERLPLDVKTGVEFLKKQPGITKVLLFGHSGGGRERRRLLQGTEQAQRMRRRSRQPAEGRWHHLRRPEPGQFGQHAPPHQPVGAER